jgi:hypothetical protein
MALQAYRSARVYAPAEGGARRSVQRLGQGLEVLLVGCFGQVEAVPCLGAESSGDAQPGLRFGWGRR